MKPKRYVRFIVCVSWDEIALMKRAAKRAYGERHGALSVWARDALLTAAVPSTRVVKEVFDDAHVKSVRRATRKKK